VLLVDDDAVIRKLSSKLLKIFGCTTDVAVDGIGAVTKMNLEKYDLVLMVNHFSLFPVSLFFCVSFLCDA
jgi:CheY-like chemotaxis protein